MVRHEFQNCITKKRKSLRVSKIEKFLIVVRFVDTEPFRSSRMTNISKGDLICTDTMGRRENAQDHIGEDLSVGPGSSRVGGHHMPGDDWGVRDPTMSRKVC